MFFFKRLMFYPHVTLQVLKAWIGQTGSEKHPIRPFTSLFSDLKILALSFSIYYGITIILWRSGR